MIVTRFAPSPTGLFHAGSYRTAIFAYLFARHHGGKFILRIEDTDRARSKKEYEDNILDALQWLNLEYDEMHRQSEWVGEHERQLRQLVEKGAAYVSKEKNEAGEERELIRFKNPNRLVTFNDAVRGDITFDTTELKDFAIAKSFTEPLFHFVVVADDARQGVTHVIRGDDHISNTPRQILIYEALGAPLPLYAHLPLVLGVDRSKLSKRKGALPLTEYRKRGYLPEGMLNYVAFLGWHPGGEQEIFTKKELIEHFSLDQVQKSGAIFDETKLKWVNREHMLRMTPGAFQREAEKFLSKETLAALKEKNLFDALVPVMRERIQTFGELAEMDREEEFAYFAHLPAYDPQKLAWKGESSEATRKRLKHTQTLLEAIPDDGWTSQAIKDALWPYAEAEGRGQVLWPLRYALSGRGKSPDPFTIAGIIGRDETITRTRRAISELDAQ